MIKEPYKGHLWFVFEEEISDGSLLEAAVYEDDYQWVVDQSQIFINDEKVTSEVFVEALTSAIYEIIDNKESTNND